MSRAASATGGSAWAPLSVPVFRAFWLASLGSNICTWINDVASGWMMVELSPSPMLVAMVQASTSLPVVLLALIAGALADIVDRRRYLIATQLWMSASALTLALLASTHALHAWNLLLLSFSLGIGAALAMPAMNATTPELVPPAMLPAAVSIGSLAINLARSIGPAVGGVLLTQFGAWAAYALNAVSFVGVAIVIFAWKRAPTPSALPPEHFLQALHAGLRYARQSPPFQAVLMHALAFFGFASAVWALLPLLARNELGGSAGTYGLLLSSVGVGAVAAALVLPRLRARIPRDRLVLLATITYALTAAALAILRNRPVLYAVMAVGGAAWISVLSSLQVAAQTSVPAWVRARALSVYIVVFSGGMALGSLLWGAVATRIGITGALLVSAACAVLSALLTRRYRLGDESLDLTPSAHWPQPEVAQEVPHDRGPVLVTVEYRIALDRREEFLKAIATLGMARRRDGAATWGVFEDVAQPGRYVESFQVASWLEHLRQHQRTTREDQRIQALVDGFHVGGHPPLVGHFVGGMPSAITPLPPDHDDALGGGAPAG
jgi:MFS family permease